MDYEYEAPVREFRLSVTLALRDQLNATLREITPAPLNRVTLYDIERRGGVYQLFLDGELVYVGKADTDIPRRLRYHYWKLAGRTGGLDERVTFRCVYVDEDLHAVSAETLLIDQERAEGLAAWNFNGFGSKDPGKNRDLTVTKRGHFDEDYPIDLGYSLNLDYLGRRFLSGSPPTLLEVASEVKLNLPYLWRFDSSPVVTKALRDIPVAPDEVPEELTAREWLEWIAARAPEGWVTVALPGYVITYMNIDPESYVSRTGSWSREGGIVVYTPHAAVYDGPADDDVEPAPGEDYG